MKKLKNLTFLLAFILFSSCENKWIIDEVEGTWVA